jgi:glycosyltransferase involved in cell wall biosynthesis
MPTSPPHLRSPKTLLVYWGTGGAGARFSCRVAQEIAAHHGADSVALSLHAGNPSLDETVRLCRHVEVVRGPQGRRAAVGHVLSLPGRLAGLQKQVRAFRPDALVIPMNFAQALAVGEWADLRKLPFIYGVHDLDPHPGDFAPTLQRVTQKRLLGKAAGLVAMSHHVADEAARRLGGRVHQRLSVAPLARHGQVRRDAPRERRGGPLRFLFLGRLVAYKGLALLSEAVRLLPQDGGWTLTVAGDGPERGVVASRFAGLGPVDAGLLRHLSEAELDALIDSHDVMVCPYVEASQSGVLAEALSFGVPAVVTPVGGLVEQVEPGAGWIASAVTAEAVAAAMLAAIRDVDGYARRSEAALALAAREVGQTPWAEAVRRVVSLP